jgi:hypothetical protein
MAKNLASEALIHELKTAVVQTRKSVMDLLEAAYGRLDNWSFVRSRVLNALGQSGLEGVIDRTIDSSSTSADSAFRPR